MGIAKGNFDSAAIDKAFLASGATKTNLGNYPFYALPRANLTNLSPVHKIQLTALNNLAVLPDKKLLVASGVDDSVETAVKLAGSNSGAVRDNPAVKSMLQAFGPAHVMFMSNSFTPTFLATQLDKLLDPNSNVADLKQKFEELQKNQLPPPLLGGFAYIAEKPGEGTYWLADYYPDAATANRALPLVDGLLRQGVSTASNKPYREYFEVISAEVKGNLTLFKVKPKGQTRLYQFVAQRDLPIFWD